MSSFFPYIAKAARRLQIKMLFSLDSIELLLINQLRMIISVKIILVTLFAYFILN